MGDGNGVSPLPKNENEKHTSSTAFQIPTTLLFEEGTMVRITELGYMGLGVKDLDAWKDFAASVIGLQLTEEGERDRCYLRMDYWHHRFVLHANGSDDLEYLGLRVANAEDFRAMQKQLSDAGIKFRVGSKEEAIERRCSKCSSWKILMGTLSRFS
jgi:hypothetical protein